MIEEMKKYIEEILGQDKSGHDMCHIERVYHLACSFAKEEGANLEIVSLASLLHDVDDYKIVGNDNAKKLTNAKNIMNHFHVDQNVQNEVLVIISHMGYHHCLNGIRPKTLEGMIVSDADMCDALGTQGIIRSIVYAVSDKGNGIVFDRNVFPNTNITAKEYNENGTTHGTDSAINHLFEKSLKLPSLMMSASGKKEACKRKKIMISFLENFFEEENALEWLAYFNDYLKQFDIDR